MDALKKRVGAFTEGIMTMVCPMLLAVALNKANLNSEGSGPIGGAILLAVVNLITCLCAFVFLVIANMLKTWNQELQSDLLYRCSKVLVHVCAILLTILAYMILLIKTNFEPSITPLVVSALFCLFPLWWCIQSVKNKERQDEQSYAGFHDMLYHSLDILASVTSFLFQMLVALALESQASNGQASSRRNSLPLCFTLVFCLFATCFMLVGTVLCPIDIQSGNDTERKEKCEKLCVIFHSFCLMLTMILTVAVPMFTNLQCVEWAVGMVIFPWISVGAVFLVCLCINGSGNHQDVNLAASGDEIKPAPLGLTKATFAGFLALLIPSFSSGTVSGSTKAFIVITAGVVISGLLWRLLTHLAPMEAAVVAADVACLLTQLLVMGAAISFALVAKDALARGNITCQIPCNSDHQAQVSILNCFMNMAQFQGKKWSSVLSSASC